MVSLIGQSLGRYEILSEVGQGGMSVVYRARDRELHRDVAVKVMHSFLASETQARERFHREAVAVARLRHPHIIEIYDYSGENAELSYIVTELISGESLADTVDRIRLDPPEVALLLIRAIADALQHAHAHDIVHRDLKPENILVSREGQLKLTDFGIARMMDQQTMTITGTLLGSPSYMAPEYIDGKATDARADIFSLGTMFYQFAVGALPFEGASPHALLKKIVESRYEPADQRNRHVHARIARIIHKCLENSPDRRYQSAAAVLKDVDALLSRLQIDPITELPKLLASPDVYGQELKKNIVPTYLQLGKREFAAKNYGASVDDLNRVLAEDPHHAEVRKILRRMRRRTLAFIGARAALFGMLGATLLTLMVGFIWDQLPPPTAPRPLSGSPTAAAPPGTDTTPLKRNVTIFVKGEGDLYVDGRLEKRGLRGRHALELAPGAHIFRFVGNKRIDEKVVTIVESGPILPMDLDVTQPAPLVTPAKERLVEFKGAGTLLTVEIDGQMIAKDSMNVVKTSLSFGTHKVRYSNSFSQVREETLVVGETEPAERQIVRLQPLPARLKINGAPDGSLVEVNRRISIINAATRNEPIRVELPEAIYSKDFEVVVRSADGRTEFLRRHIVFRANSETTLEVQSKPL